MKAVPVLLPNGVPITCPCQQGNLKLGVTNIAFGKYQDDQGKEQIGWMAALSMVMEDDRETKKAFKVYPGKLVSFGEFHVTVQRIESGRGGMRVLVEIASADGDRATGAN
jgi:hypothetical protein